MPTLGELWRAVFPTGTPDTPLGARAGVPVEWVRVLTARVPAFDALEPGDLALLPRPALEALAARGVEPAALVDSVRRARCAAVVVTGVGSDDPVVRATLARASELGIPAFETRVTDLVALERSVIGYLVNARAEVERQAARLEDQLERLALEERDIDAYAATIAVFLGRAVAVENPLGRAVAVHAPQDVPDGVAAVARYLARPRRVALRVALPRRPAVDAPDDAATTPASSASRRHGVVGRPPHTGTRARPAGALVLLGDVPPSELERVAAARIGTLLALQLARATNGSPGQQGPRRAGAGSASGSGSGKAGLPADGPPWVAVVARQAIPGEAAALHEREGLRARIRALAPIRRLVLRGDVHSLEFRLVAATVPGDETGTVLAAELAGVVGRAVAVSRPFRDVEGRGAAEAEARATLESVEALPPAERAALAASGETSVTASSRTSSASAPVVRADRLPAYRLLGALPAIPDGLRQARLLLAPLLGGRPSAERDRLETLRAVLERPGALEAAHALGVHRNTLAYRVRRIEAVTGWQLDDPTFRFALAVAVHLVQSAPSSAPG